MVEDIMYGLEGGLILVDRLEGLVDSVIHCLVRVAEHISSGSDVLVEYIDRSGEVSGGRQYEMGTDSVGVESFDTCWDRGGGFSDVSDSVGSRGSRIFLLADGVLNSILGIIVAQVVRGLSIDGVFLIVGGSWGGIGGMVCNGSGGVHMGRCIIVARVITDISAYVNMHFIIGHIVCSMQLHVSALFAHKLLCTWFIRRERLFLDNGGVGRYWNFRIGYLCSHDKDSTAILMVFGCCKGGY
jgi:hypothetical protein